MFAWTVRLLCSQAAVLLLQKRVTRQLLRKGLLLEVQRRIHIVCHGACVFYSHVNYLCNYLSPVKEISRDAT